MQMRIAKSVRDNQWGKAKALQRLLSRSFYGRLLAVKRIISNKGSRTPGIDRQTWKCPSKYWRAALNLNVRGYKAQPLRRIYILKKDGKKRPLGIPTLHDRAMEMLFAFGLKPIAETVADKHSYGFREARSLHDAVKMGHLTLGKKVSAQWILEADIKACFDEISHDWLLENTPLPQRILKQWLTCGYMESQTLYETKAGTPQGGIVSPILCNMTLDGLEHLVIKGRSKKIRKLNVIRYADDFIVTGKSPDYLRDVIKPSIEEFLAQRGLTLSQEKTHISHINDGFNFLGFNFRKFKHKLLVQPQDGNAGELVHKARDLLNSHHGAPFQVVLTNLNRVLRGWAYAYRKVVAKKRMAWIDSQLYRLLCHWLTREYQSKTWAWIAKKYRRRIYGRMDFCAIYSKVIGERKQVRLFRVADVPIRYHTKIIGDANLYLPEYDEYFANRKKRNKWQALKDRIHVALQRQNEKAMDSINCEYVLQGNSKRSVNHLAKWFTLL